MRLPAARRRGREALQALRLVPARLGPRDLLAEATFSVLRQPMRSLVTAVGTILGAATFVTTLGLTATIQTQVAETFDVRRATEVVVRPERPDLDPSWRSDSALARLRGLNGVESAGRRVIVGERPLARSDGGAARPVSITGADPGAVRAMAPHIAFGRTYEEFHEERAARVVLLSKVVADGLGITRPGVAVFIGDLPFTVIGVYDDVARRTEALIGILLPASSADHLVGDHVVERDVLIATALGAAQLVGKQALLALRPENPAELRAIAPPDPRTLRRAVEGDLSRAAFLLGLVSLVIGAVAIGNAATAAIAVRTAEIGLRRAIGGRPAHIFAQLLLETGALGGLGAAAGVILGVVVITIVSLTQRWVPVIDLRVALLATAAGAGSGLLAGLWPALRATRVQPVAALQR